MPSSFLIEPSPTAEVLVRMKDFWLFLRRLVGRIDDYCFTSVFFIVSVCLKVSVFFMGFSLEDLILLVEKAASLLLPVPIILILMGWKSNCLMER